MTSIPALNNVNILVVTGHFGSGKTNVAIGLAKHFNRAGRPTALVDLDIVNPYFRSADASDELTVEGITCINPPFANTNVDVPSLTADVHSVFASIERDPHYVAIFDVGGNNGAVALGRFVSMIEKHPHAVLYVANAYRPLTDTADTAVDDLREIEYYARMKATHLVNNSNLGSETEAGHILSSVDYANTLSQKTGLPLLFTSLFDSVKTEALEQQLENLFVIPDSTKKLF